MNQHPDNYKARIFKYNCSDSGEDYYEVVWFTDYYTKKQEIHTQIFDTIIEAEKFIKQSK